MSSWAKPGVKCVCIDDSLPPGGWRGTPLVLNRVYTVVKAVTHPVYLNAGVVLHEVSSHAPYGAYRINRFRPLVEPKQEHEDVALFEHHLKAPANV